MPEARDVRSVLDAAEQAAAAGDHASAEQLLREAALLQEAHLGPLHPDLANTLNNLGVVYEIVERPADAEHCYRRAYAIAAAALGPDHPFVVTSGKNLRDFCEARGKPVELPIPPPAVAAERKPRATGPVHLPRGRAANEPRRFPVRKFWRPIAIGALSGCALAIVVLIVARSPFSSNELVESSPSRATQPPASAPVPTPVPVEPIPVTKQTTTSSRGPVEVRESRAPAASAPAPPTVADAHVCRDLATGDSSGSSGDWRCDPVSGPVDPGLLFFYTRLKSASDTTVQHRWYHDDRLNQAVELRIRANQSGGYRTYSRKTVDTRSAGDWRVELRTRDGVLLHEERFSVR